MSGKVRFASDFDKHCLLKNFERRGWSRCTLEDDWNIFWATKESTHKLFNPETGQRLNDNQLVNHFPNHFELTRKDYMVKNIKRYRKDLEKEANPLAERDANGRYMYLDLIPDTFQLPGDYSVFAEEFKRNPNAVWICKPAASSQGKGIFLVTKLSQMRRWAAGHNSAGPHRSFVISRYLDNPLLIGGKKFDMRMYVLVTSYRPLKAYVHKAGFCRFCSVKYTGLTNMENMFVHLTNVSLQKFSKDYNDVHGGKWTVQNLRTYIESTRGKAAADKLFDDINWIFVQSLKSVQNVMVSDRHSFEMYGYDIIIDSNLKPWLIEVNASPSLSATTIADRLLKFSLINDVYNIVCPNGDMPDCKVPKNPTQESLGGFELLYDEQASIEQQEKERKSKAVKKPTSWR